MDRLAELYAEHLGMRRIHACGKAGIGAVRAVVPPGSGLDVTTVDDTAPTELERLGGIRLHKPARPDSLVYAHPAGHPPCLCVGPRGPSGPAPVEALAAMQRS